jgi:CelD/BcsL family acetyltransferase involved in cellulose biosynthesis
MSGGDGRDAYQVAETRGNAAVIDGIADEWRQLCDAAPTSLPFYRPEWVAAYVRNCEAPMRLLAAREADTLAAVLPFIEKRTKVCRIPVTVLRAPSDFNVWPFDVAIAPGADRRRTVEALWRSLRRTDTWDIVELPNVPQDGVLTGLLDAAERDGFATHRWPYMNSPYLALGRFDAGTSPLQVVRSSSLRKTIERGFRRAGQGGGIKAHYVDAGASELLSRMYELEAAGWRGDEGTAISSRRKDRVFWDEITRSSERFGYLSVCGLELDQRIIAVAVGFKYHGRYFGLKLGWDETQRSYALGHLLVHEIVGRCLDDGVDELHFMGLRSDWKTQWTPTTMPHATCYIFRRGLRGRIARGSTLRRIARFTETWRQDRGQPPASAPELEDARVSSPTPSHDTSAPALPRLVAQLRTRALGALGGVTAWCARHG